MEIEHYTGRDDNDTPFKEKLSRKQAKQSKRKDASPTSDEIKRTKRRDFQPGITNVGLLSFADAVNRPRVNQVDKSNVPTAPVKRNPVKHNATVVGRANFNTLKAASPSQRTSQKIVFGIYNVDREYSVENIREHCKKLKVRVLFCFDITNENSYGRSFKLAVRDQDRDNYCQRLVAQWGHCKTLGL